jgi:drug/metabolite transporter (DMT)-like permease
MAELFHGLQDVPFRGELLSAGSAFLWAIAVLLFRVSGRSVEPLGLNLFKSALSTTLLALTMLLVGAPLFPHAPWESYGLLILSGILGIAVSDTLFFACLNLLGAELTAIVDCFYSPFVILFSFLFIGERMGPRRLSGVALILAAMVLVSRKNGEGLPPRKNLFKGIGLGILAMVTMAAGIVMIKPMLAHTPVLWATQLRMGAATIGLAMLIGAHPGRRRIVSPLGNPANWKIMCIASFLGTYIALLAWMAGMKYTQASVAAPLNQLATVFIFVLAAVFLKEKTTPSKIAAVALATLGAFLVSWP